MAAPGIAVQFLQCLYYPCPKGIEMDVSDEGQEIIVFITEYGFIAVFKKVAGATVTAIVVLSIPR
jgi:hypothetical protein